MSRGLTGFVFGSLTRGAKLLAALLFVAALVVLVLDVLLLFGA